MMDSFFAIKLILRYGTAGAVALAVILGVCTLGFLWSMIGWPAIIVGLLAAGLAFLICKSYVELVAIVFQMVH